MPIKKLTPEENYPYQNQRLAALQQAVPEAFVDGKINWDTLREVLADDLEDEYSRQEHFGLSWPGKRQARKLAAQPSRGTLIPLLGEGVNEETTENLFIEGDNLEVMKLLLKSYAGKIKMIYIDPPYNTGNDFVYNDKFSEPLEAYLQYTGAKGESGELLTTNTRADGRFHSKWLNMIYPRLILARQLLREDGVIFISIDDNEVHNLRQLMNEVFGEENYLSELIWNLGTGSEAGHFTKSHEYILVYSKNKLELPYFPAIDRTPITHGALKKISKVNPASRIKFPAGMEFEGNDATFSGTIGGSEKQHIISKEMKFKDGRLLDDVTIEAGWAMRDQIISWINGNETYDSKGQKVLKFYFNSQGILWYQKERSTRHPKTVISDVAKTKDGSSELKDLFNDKVFNFPKPSKLLKFLVNIIARQDDIVLDFFFWYKHISPSCFRT